MRTKLVALCLVAASTPTGCGSSSPGGERETAPSVTRAPAEITIVAPADGARLKAGETARGRLRARTRVRGRARAGTTVFLSAGCRPVPCRAQAPVGADGRWAATLTLAVPRAARFVTIDASARRDVLAAGSAVATVELVGPARTQGQGAGAGGEASRGRSSDVPASETPAPRPRRTLPRAVLVIGDSLAVGMEQPLKAALAGWTVRLDGRIGRPLAEGMDILAREPSPPAILAFSLFTNDGPRNTPALEQAVRATATRPGGCAVWATVVRPPLDGVSYDAANALLRRLARDPQLAPGLRLVDWSAEVAQSPALLAPDGVHGTAAGYRALGRLYAGAIRACAGGG